MQIHHTTLELTSYKKVHIQEMCRKFLYSNTAVDNTIHHPLNELSIQAITATNRIQEAIIFPTTLQITQMQK